jgi:hypothetical protein
MFEDQKVELLPERTTMQTLSLLSGNTATAAALNAGNIASGRGAAQVNTAAALALAGSWVHF